MGSCRAFSAKVLAKQTARCVPGLNPGAGGRSFVSLSATVPFPSQCEFVSGVRQDIGIASENRRLER